MSDLTPDDMRGADTIDTDALGRPDRPNGWVRLCQDDWSASYSNQYLPDEAIDYGVCANCGNDALLYGARTKDSDSRK